MLAARIASLAGLALALAACTTTMPAGPAASGPAELSGYTFVFDLPETVQPLATGSRLHLVGSNPPLEADLLRADAGDVAETLPPPGAGRIYYLMRLAEADAAAFRAAGANLATIAVMPGLCAIGRVDVARAKLSVLAAMPGAAPSMLVRDEAIPIALARAGRSELRPCE